MEGCKSRYVYKSQIWFVAQARQGKGLDLDLEGKRKKK